LVLKINPTVAVVVVVLLVAIAGFAAWQSFGGSSGDQTSAASQTAIKRTTVEIPQATGAEPGRTAPPQAQGGGITTPLMGPGGAMTGPGGPR